MSLRYWLIAAAFGLTVGSSHAQEEASQPQGQADHQEQPAENAPTGIPVRIVENEESALASERREAEAHEIQKLDLLAQQRMADATEAMNNATQSMMWAAWVSALFVFIGTCLLVWTLWLTRQANRSAQAAVNVTREIGEAQTSAYLSVGKSEVEIGVGGIGLRLILALELKNTGQSPARDIRVDVTWNRSAHVGTEITDLSASSTETVKLEVRTSREELTMKSGASSSAPWAEITVKYRTVFSTCAEETEIVQRAYQFEIEHIDGFTARPTTCIAATYEIPSIGGFTSATFNQFGDLIRGEKDAAEDE